MTNIYTQLDFTKTTNRRKVLRELKAQCRHFKWDAQALNRATELPLSAAYSWLAGTTGAPTEKNAMRIAIKVEEIEAGAIVREDGWLPLSEDQLTLDMAEAARDAMDANATVTEPTHPLEKDPKWQALVRTNNEYAYLLMMYRELYKLNETEVLLNAYRQGAFQ